MNRTAGSLRTVCDHDAVVVYLRPADLARLEVFLVDVVRELPEPQDPIAHMNAKFRATCLCGEHDRYADQWPGLVEAVKAGVKYPEPFDPPAFLVRLQRAAGLHPQGRWEKHFPDFVWIRLGDVEWQWWPTG